MSFCAELCRHLLGSWMTHPFLVPWSPISGTQRFIRMPCIPSPRVVDRWNEKRVSFGMYDNIGILGDFTVHPRALIRGPSWLIGWKGNELQRCLRKRQMVGPRMFAHDKHLLDKRIRYLWRAFNRRGKMR